jgi:hypothetical protein
MIKYGIGPDVNNANLYNTSNTAIWNATTNNGYNNNIFGIGRDKDTTLNNIISESSTNATLEVEASVSELTNLQYFLLGDNNG